MNSPASGDKEASEGEPKAQVPVDEISFDPARELQRVLSLRQVAQWLHMEEIEIVALAEAGHLPGRRLGREWRFGALAINQWLGVQQAEHDFPIEAALAEIRQQIASLTTALIAREPSAEEFDVENSDSNIRFRFDEPPTLERLEAEFIGFVLDHHGGNKSNAAATLGIDPSTLYRKMASMRGRES